MCIIHQADVMLSNLFPHNCAVSDSPKTHQIACRIWKFLSGETTEPSQSGGDDCPLTIHEPS